MSTVTLTDDIASKSLPAAKLKPKEHGAYAILGIPIVTSLAITGPTVVGVSVAAASVAGFLAHEPLLVAWGHRGKRAKQNTPSATKRLGTLLAITVMFGTLALALGSPSVRGSLLGCSVLAISGFALAIAGKHRTLGGQMWGVIGLSVPCVPILLAGGLSFADTMQIWTTWLVGFAATTMAVRGVIAAQKRHSRQIHWLSISALSILVAVTTFAEYSLTITTLPMLAMSWYLMLDPPHARQLKRVGWTLVVGTVATAVWMLVRVIAISS
ncbi:YwiC-like family protein [Novipirellula sp. SH528]|uniref:YwiC-like family protein n=1 Tax=Novipirellula sp. SH528 TaxID=3454466 RepID=UPI003FA07996